MHLKICGLLVAILFLIRIPAVAADVTPTEPAKADKCPVCGMFVARYPDWKAQVVFQDGSVDHFDGAKDMFKYRFDLPRYRPQQREDTIVAIFVTEYYSMEFIDARQAWYVIGSDVYGPMGHELIPFSSEADARAFLQDHKGREILRYPQVTPYVIRQLDP